ncbi:MAG: hypothetical protein WC400_00580 [Patescibacteria group bacterium]|jgi:hypothetical protein
MKSKPNFIQRYFLETLAVVLVCGLSVGLGGQWMGEGTKAQTSSTSNIVTAELTDDQPTQVGQLPDQRIAQFVLSTNSPTEVTINSIIFYATGNLRHQFNKRAEIAPLSVRQSGAMLGQGSEWTIPYGLAQQRVDLVFAPITLSSTQPVTIDVYADLTKLHSYTFGVDLGRVETDNTIEELSTSGQVYKIKKFL